MKFFETDTDNNILKYCKLKKMLALLMINILHTKVKAMKKSVEQYLKKKTYLNNITNNLRASGEWKTHLTMKVNYMS